MTQGGDDWDEDGSLLRAAPGLVRIAAGAWMRMAEWYVESSVRVGSRLLDAASSGESTAELMRETRAEVRDHARRALGIDDGAVDHETVEDALRARGAELLRRSADVGYQEDIHPAYERILDELAPDEVRILRLLCLEGPQPAVDVRSSKALNMNSRLVAPRLTMIGALAGCRFVERVPAYLSNLKRLGLIWFSSEPLEDPLCYRVLEAQPEVIAALRTVARGRTVRRAIHMTPFGQGFCEVCLPLRTVDGNAMPVPEDAS